MATERRIGRGGKKLKTKEEADLGGRLLYKGKDHRTLQRTRRTIPRRAAATSTREEEGEPRRAAAANPHHPRTPNPLEPPPYGNFTCIPDASDAK